MSQKRDKLTKEVLEKALEVVLLQMTHYKELLDRTKLEKDQMDQVLMLLDILSMEEYDADEDFDLTDLFHGIEPLADEDDEDDEGENPS